MLLKWLKRKPAGDDNPADRWVRQGDRLRDHGERLKAATAYQRALEFDASLAGVRVQMGNMLKDAGFPADAVIAYREALAQGSDAADTNLQLGRALRMLGRKGEAVAALTAGLKAAPVSPDIHRELFSLGESWDDPHRPLPDVSPLAEIVGTLEEIKATIERIERQLPDAARFARIPLSRWDLHRRTWRVPPAPKVDIRIGILIIADPAPLRSLLACIGSIEAQGCVPYRVAVMSADSDLKGAVDARQGLAKTTWASFALGQMSALSAQVGQVLLSGLADCDWVLVACEPLLLEAEALGWLAHAAVQGGVDAVFCDEDVVAERAPGDPLRWFYRDPWLKDAADPELLDQGEPLGSLILVQRDALDTFLGMPSPAGESIQDWWLRLHRCLFDGGHVHKARHALASQFEQVFSQRASRNQSRPRIGGTGARSCEDMDEPVISVIIPTRDRVDLLRPCLESLRATASRSDRLAVTVVDNGSSDPETLEFLVQASRDGVVQQVLRRDEPFNWSRLNNAAVVACAGSLLVFVNNDIEMISPGWDATIRRHLSRNDVGAVGARLLYPDRTVQHAGMVLGTEGTGVEHEGRGAAASDPGPRGRWKQRRTVPAVTGAFLGCRRDAFEQVGGFDALRFGIWFSDVDFCLRLRADGLRVIYEPSIEAYHHESKSLVSSHGSSARAAHIGEAAREMQKHWNEAMRAEVTRALRTGLSDGTS
jgi:GT2 family glycosyltransferase/tetratricopeptide (TPR) repeat protein